MATLTRPNSELIRIPDSPVLTLFSNVTFCTPPLISEPMVNPPRPANTWHQTRDREIERERERERERARKDTKAVRVRSTVFASVQNRSAGA